ncbi:hypothetical protein EVG20_g9607 [Dentipellis fragilis]|uniref:Uncharacterized protein n=1 Tax=Dentipellis fragilis TaxID=205917 RepID=A0A4Y9XZB8_9AGAM|nr:hypothetical protein EVG20_g9607 [Dentipellis fragilis]
MSAPSTPTLTSPSARTPSQTAASGSSSKAGTPKPKACECVLERRIVSRALSAAAEGVLLARSHDEEEKKKQEETLANLHSPPTPRLCLMTPLSTIRQKQRGKRPTPDSSDSPKDTSTASDPPAKKPKTDEPMTQYQKEVKSYSGHGLKDDGIGIEGSVLQIGKMSVFGVINDDCGNIVLAMLNEASLAAVGQASRAAAVVVGPYLVKKVEIQGSVEKVLSFLSFVLSRDLAGKIQELTLLCTSATFAFDADRIVVLLMQVLEGANSLRSFSPGSHTIYMFNREPDSTSFCRRSPRSRLSPSRRITNYSEDPLLVSEGSNFMSASASTLTRLELHCPRIHVRACIIPLLHATRTIFPLLRVLHLHCVLPISTASELILVFPDVRSLTIGDRRESAEFFEDLEPGVDVWPRRTTTLKAPLRFILLFARRYRQPLRSVVLKPDNLGKRADCGEFLDSISRFSVQRLSISLKSFKYVVGPPVVDDDDNRNGDGTDGEQNGDNGDNSNGSSGITAVWFFTRIASAVPGLRILDLVICADLWGNINADCFRGDITDFNPTMKLIAQRLFRASAVKYLSLELFLFPRCTIFSQFWWQSSGSSSDGGGSFRITLDEYREAKRAIRRRSRVMEL